MSVEIKIVRFGACLDMSLSFDNLMQMVEAELIFVLR